MKNGNILLTIDDESFYNICILKISKTNNIEIITELKGHSNYVNHVYELQNENIVSVSSDCTIRIWKNDKNIYESIKMNEENKIYYSIEIKPNIIVNDCKNNYISFYDLNRNEKIKSINNIECNCGDAVPSFCKMNEEILLYGSKSLIYIFDIINYELIKIINSKKIFTSLYKLSENMILMGTNDGCIIQYKFCEKDLKIISFKKFAHKGPIKCLYYLKNGYILSGSEDCSFKVWK